MLHIKCEQDGLLFQVDIEKENYSKFRNLNHNIKVKEVFSFEFFDFECNLVSLDPETLCKISTTQSL